MNFEKKKIETKLAPAAIGPYSQAIEWGPFVFCSGQIGFNPETMKIEGDDITLQTRQVLKNLNSVLVAAQAHPKNIVKTTVFLTNLKNFDFFNKEYEAFFKEAGVTLAPARSTVEVSALPRGACVEIEAIVIRDKIST